MGISAILARFHMSMRKWMRYPQPLQRYDFKFLRNMGVVWLWVAKGMGYEALLQQESKGEIEGANYKGHKQ